jgi:plasmid stabilization system protein ParE
MANLKWTPQALADVARLHGFLAENAPEAAVRAVKSIRAGVTILRDNPRIGHPVEDMDPGFHEWLIRFGQSGYLVLYRVDGETVVLLAIRHALEAGYKL